MTDGIAAIRDWGARSAFKDAGGLPLVWYHATNSEDPFNVFAVCDEFSVGFHFGDAGTASKRAEHLADGDGDAGVSIVPAICRAERPLRLDDLHCWGSTACVSALEDAGVIDAGEADDILEGGAFELETLYAYLEEAGFDCVIYANATEKAGIEPTDSIFVWRAELLKSPFSDSFETSDPRLLSQNPTDPDDIAAWTASGKEIDVARTRIRGRRDDVGMRMRA